VSALINKYRPENFSEVVGQDVVVRSLELSIDKRTANAYLFSGPSGTGKTTLARLAAEALGCLPQDIQEVNGAVDTGIDEMRGVIETLMYRPLGEGAMKGIIVDECHALSKAAIQALLKIMEEPPSFVLWFLCTTEPTKVPVAIKTRCLAYQLKEVREDDLIALLESTAEAKDVEDDIIALCAKEASGSPRQALSNLGVCLVAADKKEAAELLRSASDSKEAIDLARALINNAGWSEIKAILVALKETSPESVRHVVRAYTTTVVLNGKGKESESAFAILDAFSTPFNSADGASPLVLACGRLVFAE
jgi:DNA polymerase-3 subunit gamma/tau